MSSLINPDFAKDIRILGKLRSRQIGDEKNDPFSHQEQHIRTLCPGIANAMAGFDRVAARYGLEARHPWSDKSLIEFYVSLPLRYKARVGWTKYLVRKATAPWLDESVRWNKDKDHLGRRFFRPLLNQSNLEMMQVLFTADSIGKYVDTSSLASLTSRNGRAEAYELMELYYVMTLSFWLNRLKKGELFDGQKSQAWSEPTPTTSCTFNSTCC